MNRGHYHRHGVCLLNDPRGCPTERLRKVIRNLFDRDPDAFGNKYRKTGAASALARFYDITPQRMGQLIRKERKEREHNALPSL